jgi:hypothetical protein
VRQFPCNPRPGRPRGWAQLCPACLGGQATRSSSGCACGPLGTAPRQRRRRHSPGTARPARGR